MEARAHLEHFSELALPRHLKCALRTGQKGKLGAAAYEASGAIRFIRDGARGFQIDAERLFGEKVFAGPQYFEINLFVQVMWNCNVNDIHIAACKQLSM